MQIHTVPNAHAAERPRWWRAVPAAVLVGLLSACAHDPVGPALDGAASAPAEISAGLYAVVEVERVGRPGVRDTLVARATLENRSAAPIRVLHGACSLQLHGWAEGALAAGTEPLWRSERRQPWEGTFGYGCISIGYTAVIAPGERYRHDGLTIRAPLLELLGDSIPDGGYDIAGVVDLAIEDEPGGPWQSLRTGVATLELAVARPPLRTQRSFDLVTWTARPVGVANGRIEARVDGELTHAGGMLLELPADCALRLHVYADRARRDAAPRSGTALATYPGVCGTDTRRVTLQRGDIERLAVSVPIADVLPGAAPGTYHFAVSVHTSRGQAWLDAGSAVIAP